MITASLIENLSMKTLVSSRDYIKLQTPYVCFRLVQNESAKISGQVHYELKSAQPRPAKLYVFVPKLIRTVALSWNKSHEKSHSN